MSRQVIVPERHPDAGDAVRMHAVTKEVERETVLDGVSFEVAQGEAFGLLGPDGAGKSSLLGVAAGLRVPASGSVRILGLDPLEERHRLAAEIACALPPGELADRLTCRENLELRARAGASATSPDAALTAVSLTERAGVQVAELSPGEERLLGIGCALLTDPRVLFLDEPTAGLSPTDRETVWRVLGEQRAAGRTLVLATRSLQEAGCLCDRIGVLVDGALVALGPPDEVTEEHFPERTVRFAVEAEPDRAALEELPDVLAVRIERQPDHWAIEVCTRQPAELLKLIEADPAIPPIVRVEELDDSFAGDRP